MGSTKLLIIGNVNADLIIGPMDKWPEVDTETVFDMSDLRPGGSAGNTALALKKLGTPCRLISGVGDDHIGEWLQKEYGHAADGWSAIQGPTSISVGIVHATGERTFLTTPGHLEKFTTDHIISSLDALPEGNGGIAMMSGVFLSPPLVEGYELLFSRLKDMGYDLAIDPGWPCYGWTAPLADELLRWFSQCEHILINDKEAMALAKEDTVKAAANTLSKLLPATCTIVIKDGPRGAFVQRGKKNFRLPAPRVEPFDTIGAGDCFNAGYLHGLMQEESLERSVELGILTASLAVSSFPRQHPTMADIEQLLHRAVMVEQQG